MGVVGNVFKYNHRINSCLENQGSCSNYSGGFCWEQGVNSSSGIVNLEACVLPTNRPTIINTFTILKIGHRRDIHKKR